jgi:hypothetical protein
MSWPVLVSSHSPQVPQDFLDSSPQFLDRDFAQIGGARRSFQLRDQLGREFVGMPFNHTYQP